VFPTGSQFFRRRKPAVAEEDSGAFDLSAGNERSPDPHAFFKTSALSDMLSE